ncbi:MAG TPA: hypothetical protein VEX62_08820 [Candidatus Limnocylindrales bacterium]|nr:hypothetical protein [Candidatus Limnocylindrales bacterium]
MSRRNQARRRRTYGRRQHEVRERRPEMTSSDEWSLPTLLDGDWDVAEGIDQQGRSGGEAFGGYER